VSLERERNDALDALLQWAADEVVDRGIDAGPSSDRRPPWGPNATEDVPAYREWWSARERDRDDAVAGSQSATTGALFTVLVRVGDAPIDSLRTCVDSIRRQTSSDWEAILWGPVDQGDPEAHEARSQLTRSDDRFRLVEQRPDESRWTNVRRATTVSKGRYIAFVDAHDLLHPDALAQVQGATGADADVIYSDEDAIDRAGSHCSPVFKPDWAPDLLLSSPYLGGLLVASRQVLDSVDDSGIDPDSDIDYELMLRTTERARRIVHLPRVLYHRRAGGPRGDVKGEPTRRALVAAVARRGLGATVEATEGTDGSRIRRPIRGAPSVGIVIPFRDQAALLAKCVESITLAPGLDNYEIVLVDNGSVEPETRALRTRLSERHGAKIVEYPGAFNWSAINNAGAAASTSDFFLFLNNDIEATGAGWLAALVEQGQRPEVGAVGARLLYPDGTLQHAGIVIGTGVIGWHIFMGLPAGGSAYLGWDRVVRPYSAVTGACLLTRREVFERLGGFDQSLEVAFNDVDYCLRARDIGYEVLYTPHAVLVHDEAMTRGLAGYRADGRTFLAKWDRSRLREDPFFNPNLSRFAAWCPLRRPGEDQRWEAYVDELAGEAGASRGG
jgi:GT2 family glycosyltransferase